LTDRCVTHGIAERFWATNNTLYFPFGGMTITPFDFTILIGLKFFGDSLVYQEDFHHNRAYIFEVFGPIIGNIPHGDSFPYIILFTLMGEDAGWVTHTPDQRCQIIVALFLNATILAELGNHCCFHYLFNLVDLDRVRNLNLEVGAYANLIEGIRSGVRKTNVT